MVIGTDMCKAMTAPFILRIYASCDDELLPKSLAEAFDKLPNFSKWAKATISQESVTYIWDEKKVLEKTKLRVAKMKEQAK
jgi:glutathione S-transferase